MIRYFFWICQVFVLTKAEPLKGEHVFPARPYEFPFIASLGLKPLCSRSGQRFHFCTGTLITRQHVLTAAHCLERYASNQVNVIVGDVNRRTANIVYNVDSWVTYDDWATRRNKSSIYRFNDVAIVKLRSEVNREGIVPVTLTRLNDQQLYRTQAVVAGWGYTNDNEAPDLLLRARVTILTPEKCERQLKLVANVHLKITNNRLCTFADPYVLVADGDSGGPLLDKNNFLLGVARSSCPRKQWGDFCPEFISKYKFNVHMSVNYYREFIEDVANI